jgi:prepilin-type N-terminal cleavage/methylation domain-containing protein
MRDAATKLRGFTLAESLTASVVLAVAVVGISSALSASYQQSGSHEESATALDLARELMEEISAKPFTVSGTNAGGWPVETDRSNYDTIDDFHGYQDSSDTMQLSDGSTVDVGNGGTFTRTVSVVQGVPSGLSGAASDFATVTVTVKTPRNQAVTLTQLCMKTTVVRGQ